MFADRAKVFIKSGKGGDGHVSFRMHKSEGSGGANETAADDRCFSWIDGLSHMGYLLYLQNCVGLVTVQ